MKKYCKESRWSKTLLLFLTVLLVVSCQQKESVVKSTHDSPTTTKPPKEGTLKIGRARPQFYGDLDFLNYYFWNYPWGSHWDSLYFSENTNACFIYITRPHDAAAETIAGLYTISGKRITLEFPGSDSTEEWARSYYDLYTLDQDNVPYTFNDLASDGFEPWSLSNRLYLISTEHAFLYCKCNGELPTNTIYCFDGVKFELLYRADTSFPSNAKELYQSVEFIKRGRIFEKPVMNDNVYSFKYPDSEKSTDSLYDFSPDEYGIKAFARTVQKFPDKEGNEAYWYLCEIWFPGIGSYQNEYFIGGESHHAKEGSPAMEPGAAYGWVYGPDIGLE